MQQHGPHRTAEEATPHELWGATIRLLGMLVILILLFKPTGLFSGSTR